MQGQRGGGHVRGQGRGSVFGYRVQRGVSWGSGFRGECGVSWAWGTGFSTVAELGGGRGGAGSCTCTYSSPEVWRVGGQDHAHTPVLRYRGDYGGRDQVDGKSAGLNSAGALCVS